MDPARPLGEFEHVVLLALARTGGDAYGADVHAQLEAVTRRAVLVPAVYVTFARLERKGLVRVRDARGTVERGQRARKRFQLTSAGVAALRRTRAELERFWSGIDFTQLGVLR
jgi:DNA-binding PadR family transcriptional regulator